MPYVFHIFYIWHAFLLVIDEFSTPLSAISTSNTEGNQDPPTPLLPTHNMEDEVVDWSSEDKPIDHKEETWEYKPSYLEEFAINEGFQSILESPFVAQRGEANE